MSLASHLSFDSSLIKEVSPYTYEIPIGFIPNMNVPCYFYSSPDQYEFFINELNEWLKDKSHGLPSLLMLASVSTLTGISKGSFAMPDMHSGYGFTIGGVAAFDLDNPNAKISPGGVGNDINCGVRCLTTHLKAEQVEPVKEALISSIEKNVPSGIGGGRKNFISSIKTINEILEKGAQWALENKYAFPEDIELCEEHGRLSDARPDIVTEKMKGRGINQVGTIGSGNHYVEIQTIEQIFDEEAAQVMGLVPGEVVVMIHTGSRGLGAAVATEYINELAKNPEHVNPINKQLSSVPFNSEEGQKYWGAMCAAANYAWCNRQIVTHFVRESFKEIFGDDVKLDLIYDVAHNIAKIEEFDGKRYLVHRKGATRAFGPGRPEIPEKYRSIGQPVLIGGSLGTASYILVGTEQSMGVAFGSTCHGSGRLLSRSQALKTLSKEEIEHELVSKRIIVKAASAKTIIDEAPQSYKDVDTVVDVCQSVGLSKKVARTIPMAVIKG